MRVPEDKGESESENGKYEGDGKNKKVRRADHVESALSPYVEGW